RCYCSEAELEKEREACIAQGLDPRYGGRCRELTPAAEAAFQAAGRRPVIRFKVPDEGNVVVDDLVRGEVAFDCAGIGDFVIVKSDGIPTYNFAVVMDDVSMGITHVIRGEEHLSNTPRQLLIYEALSLPKPRFAHVSLILGKDRSKMSKRHGATAVAQYRSKGYLPEALVNFLALLGWSPGDEEEVFSLAQLSERFSLDRVAKNPAVFDLDKLNWLNGVYIRQAAPERIAELAAPFLVQAGYLQEPLDAGARAKVALIAAAVQEKIEYVAQVTDYAPLFFGEKVAFASEAEKAVLAGEQVPAVLAAFVRQVDRAEELSPAGVKSLLKAVTKETKQKGGRVFMPIRVALTGQQHGPDLQYLIPALGRELVFARVKNAAEQVGIEL
ncbi:MAG: glutamate--tRNA ligase, partial [Heliobacteriaceae bacterium]|nr:glutamate--tRNA ligase [Heliobacteriaceae bacterium]